MKDNALILRLLAYLAPFKKRLVVIGLCLLVYSSVFLTYPLLNKALIDNGILRNDFKVVVTIALYLLALLGANSMISIVREKLRAELAAEINKRLFNDIFKALMNTHVHFFHQRDTTSLYNDVAMDVHNITRICDNNVFFIVTQLLGFIGGSIGLMIIDLRLIGIVILFIPIKFFLVLFFSSKRKALIAYLMGASNRFSNFFGDSTAGTRDIRLFGVKDIIVTQFSDNIAQVADTEKRIAVFDEMNTSLDLFMMHALETILYIIGSYFIFQSSLSIGSLFAFITYSIQVMNPIASFLNLKYVLTGILPSANRYFQLLDTCLRQDENTGSAPIQRIEQIDFINVSYSYANKKVLKDVSFSLKQGDRVAVIGNNGSGKSTLLDIIERFITPSHGQILVNGLDYTEYSLEAYRNTIGCMNQDNHIFNLTIAQNVKFFRKVPDADLDQLFGKLPVNYFSFISERQEELAGQGGANLSGGQKQKIALARLLPFKKSLYLLDEPTASLDGSTKTHFQHFLSQAFNSCIVIMITHDLSLLEWANIILRIEDSGNVGVFTTLRELIVQDPDAESLITPLK